MDMESTKPASSQSSDSSRGNKTEKSYGKKKGSFKKSNVKSEYKDPSWYIADKQITSDVANVAFNRYPGSREVLGVSKPITNASTLSQPGVLGMGVISSYGDATFDTSAINVLARALYTEVRHKNSGHSNYESADLAIYILAMSEVYDAIVEAKKIYGLAFNYEFQNRNTPDLLFRSMYVNGDSIRSNLAQFRAAINLRIAKLNQMVIPKAMGYFLIHAYRLGSVFTDDLSKKAQYYNFYRKGYRVYDPTATNGGALHYYKAVANDNSTFKTYLDIINEIDAMLDPIINDEDMNIMSGDILKWLNGAEFFSMALLPEDYKTPVVYDESVLEMIHNAEWVQDCDSVWDFNDGHTFLDAAGNSRGLADVFQNDNTLYNYNYNDEVLLNTDADPRKYLETSFCASDYYFNSFKKDPSPEEIVEWSDLIASSAIEVEQPTDETCAITYWRVFGGTHIIAKADVWEYTFASGGVGTFVRTAYHMVTTPLFMAQYIPGSKFDWFPRLYYNLSPSSGTFAWRYMGVIADLKNYTILTRDFVHQIDENISLGALGGLVVSKNTFGANK